MEPDDGGLFGGPDGSVKALGDIWGERGEIRRMNADEQSLRAVIVAKRLGELGFEGMEKLASKLADASGAKNGWETEQLIKALGAVKAQQVFSTPTFGYRRDE